MIRTQAAARNSSSRLSQRRTKSWTKRAPILRLALVLSPRATMDSTSSARSDESGYYGQGARIAGQTRFAPGGRPAVYLAIVARFAARRLTPSRPLHAWAIWLMLFPRSVFPPPKGIRLVGVTLSNFRSQIASEGAELPFDEIVRTSGRRNGIVTAPRQNTPVCCYCFFTAGLAVSSHATTRRDREPCQLVRRKTRFGRQRLASAK